jgi:hypothetical protein
MTRRAGILPEMTYRNAADFGVAGRVKMANTLANRPARTGPES